MSSSRMISVIQTTAPETLHASDFDLVMEEGGIAPLLAVLIQTASREYTPKMTARGNVEFQITRGRLGISM